MAILVTTIVLLCVLTSGATQCPNGFIHHVDSCYHFSHDTETWVDAQSVCEKVYKGASLAEIQDDRENSFLLNEVNSRKGTYWIGASDIRIEGEWVWEMSQTDVDVKSHSWYPGNPSNGGGDENCMELMEYSNAAYWNDNTCHLAQRYICEKSVADGVEVVGR